MRSALAVTAVDVVAVHPRAALADVGDLQAQAARRQALEAAVGEVARAAGEDRRGAASVSMSSSRRAWPWRAHQCVPRSTSAWGAEALLERVEVDVAPWCRRTRRAARAGASRRVAVRRRAVVARPARSRDGRRRPRRRASAAAASIASAGQARAQAPQPRQTVGVVGDRCDRSVTRAGTSIGPVGRVALQAPQRGARARRGGCRPARRGAGSRRRSRRAGWRRVGQAAAHLPQPTQSSSWRTISQPSSAAAGRSVAAAGARGISRPRWVSGIRPSPAVGRAAIARSISRTAATNLRRLAGAHREHAHALGLDADRVRAGAARTARGRWR